MQRRHGRDAPRAGLILLPFAARGQDAGQPEQPLGGGAADAEQDIGVGELDLALDEGQADRDLLRRRRAVAGRPPGQEIGDVDVVLAAQPDGGEHPVEQLARAPDEGQADAVFIRARRLADDHDSSVRVAVGEDQALGGRLQRAALEPRQRVLQLLQRRGLLRQGARAQGCVVGGRRGGGVGAHGHCGRLAATRRQDRPRPRGLADDGRGEMIMRDLVQRLGDAHVGIPGDELGRVGRGGQGHRACLARRHRASRAAAVAN